MTHSFPTRRSSDRGQDIHAATSIELFGEVNRDTRGKAKTVNFSILYGISRWGLAGRLEITPDEAQALIARYFERFPGISDYITDTLEGARAKGYTETLFGRKTWFPRIKAASQHERQGSGTGRASCGERVWQYGEVSVGAVPLKKKTHKK